MNTHSTLVSAFSHDEFRLFFTGLAAANLGNWIQQFAVGWLTVQVAIRDGNPALGSLYLGLISLAAVAPALASGLFAGVYMDRTDRRVLLVAARAASCAAAVMLAWLVIADHIDILVLMALSAASAAAFAFDPPGQQAMLPSIVPLRDLLSAIGLTRATTQAAKAIGPLLGGLLIGPIGVGGVIAAKAVLGLLSIVALLPMRSQPPEPSAPSISVPGSLGEGFEHMWGDVLIRWCVLLQLLFALLAQSFNQLLPVLAVDTLHVGALELSWLGSSVGVGAVVGAVVVASLSNVDHRGRLLVAALFSLGLLLILLGLQEHLLGTLVVLAALGGVQQIFAGTQTVILQQAAPDRMRGRVMAMQSVVFLSFGPIGVLIVGSLGTLVGISASLVLAGSSVALASVLVGLRVAALRNHRGSLALSLGTTGTSDINTDWSTT